MSLTTSVFVCKDELAALAGGMLLCTENSLDLQKNKTSRPLVQNVQLKSLSINY